LNPFKITIQAGRRRGVMMENTLMEDNQSGFYYGYVVVAAVFVVMAIIWGTFSTFGVFFESFIETFGWTRALTSGASSARDLVFGVVCILTARLADPFGPRVVITTSGLLLGVGYVMMSQVQTTWQLYIYFGVIISSGMSSYILMLSIVAKWFERRRGMMTALSLSGMGIGTMVVPPISNSLITIYGWRTSYVIIAISASVLVVLAAQFLKYPPNEPNPSTSTDNAPPEHETFSDTSAISFRQALGTRQFWLISALYFFFLFPLLTVLVHVVIHAIGMGVSSKSASSIIAVIGGLSVVGMNCAGSTADKIENKRTFIICFILMAVSFVFLMVAGAAWTLYLFAAIFGLAYGGMQVLFSPIVAELFGLASHGLILASAAFIGSFGAALGPLVSGHIFDLTKSYGWAFFTCLIMTIVSIKLASLLKPVQR
jgi:MFS family permease